MDTYVAQDIYWDLSAFFISIQDPKIKQIWDMLFIKSKEFTKKYKGNINHPNLSSQTLLDALKEYEQIGNELSKPCGYASLLFATDTADPQIGQFYQKQQELASQITVQQLFFSLELQALPESQIINLLEDPLLKNYKHPVKVMRLYSDHRLTEPEEIILEELANTGKRAWKRFFEELVSSLSFDWKKPGEEKSIVCTKEVLLNEFRNPDRSIRQSAADTFTEGLKKIEKQIVSIYNNILQEKKITDRLRKYSSPESSRHLSNELEEKIVETVMQVCDETQDLVARYYEVKKEVLGLEKLTHIDRYAPLGSTHTKMTYDEAKNLILDSFKKFHPTLEYHASQFFSQNWIDATPAPNKRGGAFCMYNTPDTHPVVFMSYLGSLSDVKTLAHELGHGVHSSLSRKQTYFNFHGTLPLAELASTLGEMIVFDKLVQTATLEDKIALYAQKIEDVFATVYRQSAMYRFEQNCHYKCREEGELTPDILRKLWQDQMQKMFGESVSLAEQHEYWWLYVSHFFASPFYVYAYSFGELLALSIYYKAKELGGEFIEKYIQVLELGGSKSPQELMQNLGIDISSKDFWYGGTKLIEQMIEDFEQFWSTYKIEHKGSKI